MLIVGIDTGSTKCGYAVLRVEGPETYLLECGVFHATSRPANDNGTADKWARMALIGADFVGLLNQYGVGFRDTCGIESAYIPVGRTFGVETLAEVRGILAYEAIGYGMRVVTVSPSTVKKAVTGSGKADKALVADVVRKRFKLSVMPAPDACDAVGVALAVSQGAGK